MWCTNEIVDDGGQMWKGERREDREEEREEREQRSSLCIMYHSILTLLFITCTQLSKLSVVHVAGTKGKGSTCALTESILRYSLLSSLSCPHLLFFLSCCSLFS